MKRIITMHCLPFACLLVTALSTTQLSAGGYGKQSENNINPGYGGFPPSNIDEVLNGHSPRAPSTGYGSFPHADIERKLNRSTELARLASEQERKADPEPVERAYSSYQSATQPESYATMPNNGYYGYDSPGSADSNIPWGYNGSDFKMPWSTGDSGFSPWGKRGWAGNRNPFSNSGLDDWFKIH